MYRTLKNVIDRVLAFVGLIVLSPVFLSLNLALKMDSEGHVLFRNKRVGEHKQYFNISSLLG